MTAICFRRAAEAALCYHVLSHLPLPRDAASLFDPTLPPRPWVEPLRRAYLAAPGRLVAQGLALRYPDGGLDALAHAPPAGLCDEAGRQLLDRLHDAIAREREPFMHGWNAAAAEAEAMMDTVSSRVLGPLTELRHALWEQHGPPPPLTVLDCPALDRAGRGTTVVHERRVAVSVSAPVEHVLCQILHEEIHPITDPVVREGQPGPAQDTRGGSAGHAIHAALEHAAVEVGQALILARAPRWAEAYARWRTYWSA